MEPLESYSQRFWARLWKDAAPWARDNIFLAIIMLVVPPFAIYIRNPHAQIDWPLIGTTVELYLAAFAIYFIVQLCHTAPKLDRDRETREKELGNIISDKDQAIAQRDQSIDALKQNPPLSPADQHNCERLKKLMRETYKDIGIAALRHIRNVGTITVGGAAAVNLPTGLPLDKAMWVYNGCAAEGLLIHKYALGMSEQTFSVPTNLGKVFDEALYESN